MKIYSKCLIISVITLCIACNGNRQKASERFDNIQDAEKYFANLFEVSLFQFDEEFSSYLLSDTSSINYPFEMLVDSGIYFFNIISSKDGYLRFYSWCMMDCAFAPDYGHVYQYVSDGKVYSVKGTLMGNRDKVGGFYTTGISNIHTLVIDNQTVYLVHVWERFMNNRNNLYCSDYMTRSIKAFKIIDGQLKEEKLFKTKFDTLSEISIEYCFDRNADYDGSIFLDEFSSTLYIPIVRDFRITDQYLLYQLKENIFEYIESKVERGKQVILNQCFTF